MDIDGTLTLLAPRRHLAWHWLLAGGGDPADLAERLSPLGSRLVGRIRPPSAGPGRSADREPLGDALLHCLATALPLGTALPLNPARPRDLALPGSLALPAGAGEEMAGGWTGASFHTQLTLQRWHCGPLWIAIWRCHGHLGWQRRCGPMSLMAFLAHPWQRPRRSGPQSTPAVPPLPCHGP